MNPFVLAAGLSQAYGLSESMVADAFATVVSPSAHALRLPASYGLANQSMPRSLSV
jgi:hypothetical protein